MQGEARPEPDRVQPVLLRRGHPQGVRGARHRRAGLLARRQRQQGRDSGGDQVRWVPICKQCSIDITVNYQNKYMTIHFQFWTIRC